MARYRAGNDAAPKDGGDRSRPLIFLHIPKTAGTSMLTTLGNAFGESHVWRLSAAEVAQLTAGALALSPPPEHVGCIAGHFPIHPFAGQLDSLRVFTILRHPVERVMSLYRFLRRQPPHELTRLGLRPAFTFDEFLDSRSGELFGQVRNGMCRLLARDRTLGDSSSRAFWRARMSPAAVEQAVDTLGAIQFGISEAMGDTLTILAHMLDLPLDLTDHAENVSEASGTERNTRNLLKLVELNTGDIALYRAALAIFAARLQRLDHTRGQHDPVEAIRLSHLDMGQEMRMCDVAGRQGFFAYEPKMGFSWLRGAEGARMAFAAAPSLARLRLRMFRITDDYPMDRLGLSVNGAALAYRWERHDEGWGVLETEPFEANPQNLLTLTIPFATPVRQLFPKSPDKRQLSVAVATVTLLPAET